MIDHAVLKAELESDPAGVGYQRFIVAGDDATLAARLNRANGPAGGTLMQTRLSKGDLMLALIPAVLSLGSKAADVQVKWDRILAIVRSVDDVRIGDPTVRSLFNLAVADGLLNQAQAQAIGRRACSRAEALFGEGVTVSVSDVSIALRGR